MMVFLVGALLGALLGGALCVRYLRQEIAATDRAARLSRGHDNRIDSGPCPGHPTKVSRPPRKLLPQHGLDVARLEKLIRPGVPVRSAAETLHQHDAGYKRRPQPFAPEDSDQGGRLRRALGKHAHAAAVQNEHGPGSARLLGVMLADAPGDRLGPGQLGR